VPAAVTRCPSAGASGAGGQYPSVDVGDYADDDDAAVEQLLAKTSAKDKVTLLKYKNLDMLITHANELGIKEVQGHRRHKKTWVEAILTFYEVSAAAEAASAAASPSNAAPKGKGKEKAQAQELLSSREFEDNLARLERVGGFAKDDCQLMLLQCNGDYLAALTALMESRRIERGDGDSGGSSGGGVMDTLASAGSALANAIGFGSEARAQQEQAATEALIAAEVAAEHEEQHEDRRVKILNVVNRDRRARSNPSRLLEEHVRLALRAQLVLHDGKAQFAQSPEGVLRLRFEAYGLGIEAKYIPAEIESIANREYQHHECYYCRRLFKTMPGRNWHEERARKNNMLKPFCDDWATMGRLWATEYDKMNGYSR
jgi:hypothetical protein